MKENLLRSPIVRTQYAEVQEIDMVSHRSMHITTKVDKKWLPVTAFRDCHVEDQYMQKKVNDLNAPRIFFFRDSKAPTSSITLKHLNRIHRDMDRADYTQMATECSRLGHKVSKAVELWISRVIQECQICKHEDMTFSH